MYILGLGGSNHDFSACLLKDGEVRFMVDDERITRKKYGVGLGLELAKGFSRNYCLQNEGISLNDVELIVGNDILSKTMYHRLEDKIVLINHHLAHAAGTFYPSHFDEAAILIVDGVGSKQLMDGEYLYESVTYALGVGSEIKPLQKQYGKNLQGTDMVENSLGIFYSIITEIIDFGEHEEGKTMGLAPYGTANFYNQIKKHIRYKGKGQVEMTETDIKNLLELKKLVDSENNEKESFQLKADIAFAGQQILEEIMLELCNHLHKITNIKNICLSGGVALNSVANYRIYKEGQFKDIFVQPAAADNGTSIGAALYGHYTIKGHERKANQAIYKTLKQINHV